MPQKTPQWYDVPANTRPSECNAPKCKAVMYWITTPRGAKMPIDCDEPGGYEPTSVHDGRGVAHWGTCADPEYFRRKK